MRIAHAIPAMHPEPGQGNDIDEFDVVSPISPASSLFAVISFSYITANNVQLARIPEGDTSAQQFFQERPPGEAAETVSRAQ